MVLWGAKEEEWIHKTTLRCHEEGISQVGFSSDSTRVLTASDDKSAKLFDGMKRCIENVHLYGSIKNPTYTNSYKIYNLPSDGCFDFVYMSMLRWCL